MNLADNPNINYLWANLIVEELIRNGADTFFIAPGSRSSPLTLTVAKEKRATSITHFDERGLGFYALGFSSATKKPCVIITTSGTAVANLLPAVVEAAKKKLPLIILTADRPVELRQTGSHQTIDQVGIFGNYTRFFFDMPCPTTDINPAFVLTTIDQAVARAKGNLSGPVHLNCPFRDPLTPIKISYDSSYLRGLDAWGKSKTCYTVYPSTETLTKEEEWPAIAQKLEQIRNGVIVIGKIGEHEQEKVLQLADHLGWPVFPDITSGLRLGCKDPWVISYFDQILLTKLSKKIDGVIHLGGRITSKRWYEFVLKNNPAEYMMVLSHPLRNDPLHNVTTRIRDNVSHFCKHILFLTKKREPSAWAESLKKMNIAVNADIEDHFKKDISLSEIFAARAISRLIPEGHGLFLANSLPLREIDMFASAKGNRVVIGGNRGASGIDGTIASAVGFAEGLGKPVTLLIGDLAFLHDLNSLALLKESKQPIHIVVLNNNGGGIFNFLPIAEEKKEFEKYFALPHHVEFENVCDMFKIKYNNPKQKKDFESIYLKVLTLKESSVIEIQTKREQTVSTIKHLQSEIVRSLK
jgi:2-succinyl-5-enolpyruvyl-6-hydroxy-3-cyclohexene-1-carboxylate synthase